jgi:hypothetical protein
MRCAIHVIIIIITFHRTLPWSYSTLAGSTGNRTGVGFGASTMSAHNRARTCRTEASGPNEPKWLAIHLESPPEVINDVKQKDDLQD